MLGLVMNQEREEAKTAATQNSPPLDLLGEIWGGGLALLQKKKKKERDTSDNKNIESESLHLGNGIQSKRGKKIKPCH